MNVDSRKVAAVVVAVGAIGLLGTACSSDDDSASNTSAAMSSPMSNASGATASSDAMEPNGMDSGASKPTTITTDTELTTVGGQQITIGDEAIAKSYGERGGPDGYLGKPLGPVVKLKSGGSFITFEHGSLYQNPATGAVYAVHGEIGDEWGRLNHENGRLGYPTSDETKIEGGLEQTYDNGTIKFVGGKVTVTPAG
ncbi:MULTISPECIES: LGFP repeat-containing protein [Gordonia]|uniref:LGFP repeat-containing protein n=2 Tax=Gordonia TaxID=2053 RepID=L7LFM6_9ACTN|nr:MULTISPECIES: hypothetical protein [Gordonia]AUH68697.1 hypothetical protein CXX93_10430 [Gordonia sp. YC-JH1]KXT57976.1 LGFP repeat protein [Gordonia sp. QH-12]MBY4571281.1 hypothetical protein [Gordonia sihwensis]WFN91450.1 hypothetical protein P5P27_11710 [Gordonia sihwensis]GAC59925.1 hypothetical protein GSI01S_06_00800 [Gordonia sihwensis NBRC 108236]